MKKIIQTTFFLCLVTLSSICIATDSGQKVEGWVINNEAIFSFPVAYDKEIEWNRKSTRPNFQEYTYCIDIGEYSFGFFLYKNPWSKARKGTFAQLVKRGQLSVFKKDNYSSELIRNATVEIEDSPNIFIKVKDIETFEMIFKNKPTEFTYWFTDKNGKLVKGNNALIYK